MFWKPAQGQFSLLIRGLIDMRLNHLLFQSKGVPKLLSRKEPNILLHFISSPTQATADKLDLVVAIRASEAYRDGMSKPSKLPVAPVLYSSRYTLPLVSRLGILSRTILVVPSC